MRYKRLGESGLQVSSLALGTMTFGDGADEATCAELYQIARDHGVTVFDSANVYALGESERILGRLIKEHRSEIILASKAYYPMSDNPNDQGLGRRHLVQSLHASLERLQTDYLDIFYLHAFDLHTPLEESMRTLDDFVRAGKVLYVGVSNFAAWQVMKALEVGKRLNTTTIHCVQPMYNLLKRQAESELFPMALSEGLGVFTYSPLAGGLLSGKYHDTTPKPGRFNESEMYRDRYQGPEIQKKVTAFLQLAQSYDLDLVALAIAWSASHPAVTAPMIGARTPEQLKRALHAAEVVITSEIAQHLDAIMPPPPLATDREEER